jgi:uncharacterized protein
VDPVGYELRTNTGGKGEGVHATRCFDLGETVMVGMIERRVAGNDSHATQVGRSKWVRHGGLGPRNNSVEHFPGGCLCGADACRGSIAGWKDLADERKAAYRGSVAPYLLEIDRETAAP